MLKDQVIAILSQKKQEQIDAVAAVFDGMILAVEALSEDNSAEILALQNQVADLQNQLAAKNELLFQVDAKFKEGDALIPDA